MATFENIRYCQKSEYDYFEEERRDLASLQTGELCVAMFELDYPIDDNQAIALPLQVVSVNPQTIIWRGFDSKQALSGEQQGFTPKEKNYLASNGTVILPHEVPINLGYMRDHHEGLDGNPVEIEFSNSIPVKHASLRSEPVFA